jgi:predicted nucleic acid-binding Zn ribbon protein
MIKDTMKFPSSPTPVGAILPAVLPGLGERLLEARIQKDWETLMGLDIARRAQPLALSQGILQVAVTNSPWLQELTLREPDLRRRLADHYGAEAIRALRFSLRTLPNHEASDAKDHRRPGRSQRPGGRQ